MAFSFDPANIATQPLDAARSVLGDIEASGFILHNEEISAQLVAMAARPALIGLARMMRTRVGMRASSSAAGPFRKAYDDRMKAIDALIGDLASIPLPGVFGDAGGSGPMGAASGNLCAPNLDDYKTD